MHLSGHGTALTRRGLLQATAGAGLLGAAGCSALGLPGGGGPSRPNVLWIVTDDQTRRMLKLMPRTMRDLVGRGTNFVHGYAAVPWCGPSRATMLTGLYAHNHGVISNDTNPGFVRKRLDRDTVATRMHAAGYATGFFGKYLNGQGKDPAYVAPGWDRWMTTIVHVGDTNQDGHVGRTEVRAGAAPDALAATECQDFLRSRASQPWFAVFSPTTPHDPYRPSRAHRHDFDGVFWDPPSFNEKNLSDKPAFMRSLPRQDRHKMQRIYEGKLEELQDLDDQIAGLLSTLEQSGQLDRTVIMLVSDNGYLLGEHRLFQKKQPYEESAGVPFVVAGPEIPAATSTALVSLADLMPTTLALAGLDPDVGRASDGRSLLAPLRSGDWSRWRRRLYTENPKLGWSMLREGRFAYIEYPERHDARELYDLEADPYEMRSVAAEVDTSAFHRAVAAMSTASGRELRALER